jgi:Tfp pilus assembly protein PilX
MGRDERGSILLGGLMLVLIMTLVGSGVFALAVVENRVALGDVRQAQAFYTAEAGLNAGLWELAHGTAPYDFAAVFGAPSTTTLFTNKSFGGGSFTVTAQAVASSNPNSITVISIGCMPAATGINACQTGQAQSILQATITQQLTLAGPFFALGKFSLSGGGSQGALVDSFDSSPGPSCPGPNCYNNTKCRKQMPPFDCGADVYAGSGSTPTTQTVSIGNNAKVYGNITNSQGLVDFNGGANIYGNLTYAPSPNGGCTANCTSPTPVHGQVIMNSTSSPVPSPVQPCGPPYSPSTYVNGKITGNGWTYSQSTGDFNLGANKTITIAGGTFCFHTFTSSGTVTISDPTTPVVLFLTQGLSITSNGSIANTTGKAQQFQILSSAICTGSCVPSAPTNSIQISGGTGAYVYVYAPKTQIAVSGGSDLYGALLGNDLQASGGAQLHFDKALGNSGNLYGGVPAYAWGSWKVCKNPQCT